VAGPQSEQCIVDLQVVLADDASPGPAACQSRPQLCQPQQCQPQQCQPRPLTAAITLSSVFFKACSFMIIGCDRAAAGAGLIGISILTCGFFIPPDRIPAPLWRYPLHYLNFITYAFAGLMNNEFEGSGSRWQCPCLLQVSRGMVPSCMLHPCLL
jgi:hypothetical protein